MRSYTPNTTSSIIREIKYKVGRVHALMVHAWPDRQPVKDCHKVVTECELAINRSWQSSLWTVAKSLDAFMHELEHTEKKEKQGT